MFELFRKLNLLLDARERRRGGLVLALLILVALVETLGVASVMPFIAVLADPAVIHSNRYLAALYAGLSFETDRAFLLFLGVTFLAILLGSLVLRGLGLWAQFRFSYNREWAWSVRLVERYLRQPFEWYLTRHSSKLATSVVAEVWQVVSGALLPAMQVVANILVVFFLLVMLVAVDPFLATSVGGVLIGGYALVSWIVKWPLVRIGQEWQQANRERYHVVQEAFGGIKDVKLGNHEQAFVDRFSVPAARLAKHRIVSSVISDLPSLAMQGLLFGGMMLLLLYLVFSRGGFQEAVPIAALYAFAAYRLMPAVQNVYRAISSLRYSGAVLDSLYLDFCALSNGCPDDRPETESRPILCPSKSLELVDVSYTYPGTIAPSLAAVCLEVPARTTVGLVGPTGSGKSTAVDLLLGLLRPTKGALRVDGVEITDPMVRQWQRSLGYVPQQIFLSDGTVANNIAFGCPESRIDMAAVERAARIANLHEFVTRELPDGYGTRVGERGIRLSGGQRQRVGIARALYHDPEVLIMDEATSALDNLTEHAVMDAVRKLGRRKTIVLIAHRLSTVRGCDRIYLLESGKIHATGTYEELVAQSDRFRAMAELG